MRHSRSRTPIGRRYRSSSADRESSEPQLILPYEGLDEDGLDMDRGCWLVPNRERVDRRWRSPSRGVASGVVRAPVRVRAPVSGPSRDAFGVRDPVGTSAGVRGPCPVRDPVWDPGPVRSGTRSAPPGVSGLRPWLLSMIGAAHVFVITTPRPHGLIGLILLIICFNSITQSCYVQNQSNHVSNS